MSKVKTDRQLAKNLNLTEGEYKKLANQVSSEITTCVAYCTPDWELNRKRIKLYNNQKKKATAVSDPMLFTQIQTVLASLYADKLQIAFNPREPGDVTRAENLNMLYEFDSVEMEKEIFDYKLGWNACFFGRGVGLLQEWDSKRLVPVPEVVNMLTFHRDPNATSVNGDSKGRGALRFFGRPISKTLSDFYNDGNYKNLDALIEAKNTEEDDAQMAIDEAQGYSSLGDVEGDNKNYTIMEWWTRFGMKNKETGLIEQKRVLVGYQDGLIVRFTVLKDQDQWAAVDKTIYPDSLSWDGVSITDLIEDKQRFNAKLLNAAGFSVDSNTYKMGFYDATKITNASHLNFGYNKRIPVRGSVDGVYAPMPTNQVGQEVSYIMSTLEGLAQKATAASNTKMGAATTGSQTATETATIAQGADTRFSLAARIFGWSEKAFARYWYKMYKLHYNSLIDSKVVRVNGLIGYKWSPLSKDDIIGKADPDVKVDSLAVNEAKRQQDLQNFTNAYPILSTDPDINKEFLNRQWAKLNGYNTMDMKMLFKDNPDRIVALEENMEWRENKKVPKVRDTDNDWIHIEEHQKEKGMEKHIKAHMKMSIVKAKNTNVQDEVAAMQPEEQQVGDLRGQSFDTPNVLQIANQ